MTDEQDGQLSLLERRISELNNKASQLLTALSFAIAAAILLKRSMGLSPCEGIALRWSLRFWVLSFFPVLAMIVAVKEFQTTNISWYQKVRTSKVVLLWVAVVMIGCGAVAFLCAVW